MSINWPGHCACAAMIRESWRIPAAGWKTRLRIVGEGEKRPALEAFSRAHGLEDRVELPGCMERKAVLEAIRRADIFALTTHYEGLPRTVVEAMHAGLPIIASDVWGVRELFESSTEENEPPIGILVKQRNAKEVSAALEHLIVNPQSRLEMGRAAARRARTHFNLDTMVQETLGVYQEVLRRRAPAAYSLAGTDFRKSPVARPDRCCAHQPGTRLPIARPGAGLFAAISRGLKPAPAACKMRVAVCPRAPHCPKTALPHTCRALSPRRCRKKRHPSRGGNAGIALGALGLPRLKHSLNARGFFRCGDRGLYFCGSRLDGDLNRPLPGPRRSIRMETVRQFC